MSEKQGKKYVSLLLRLGVAALGVGYIVWSLTWSDSVLVPSDYELADGVSFQRVMELRIVGEDKASGEYELRLPGGEEVDGSGVVRVAKADVGDQAGSLQYRKGIFSTLGEAKLSMLGLGLLLIGMMFPVQGARWWLLLRCRGLGVELRKAFRLTMVGLFFNFCMPGMTGGDVVKAYYAAKGSGQRGVAVMSVAFDRIAGLFGLIILAGIVGLMLLGNELARSITAGIWILIGVIVAGGCVYFSQRTRKLLGITWLLSRFPEENIFAKLDRAAVAYRHHTGAVLIAILISLPVHMAQVGAVALAGYSLGMEVEVGLMFTVLPVVFLAGALPISYQGLGVMEGLGIAFLAADGMATNNQVVGMLLIMRIFFIVYAMLSSAFVLRGDVHLFPQVDEG